MKRYEFQELLIILLPVLIVATVIVIIEALR